MDNTTLTIIGMIVALLTATVNRVSNGAICLNK